MSDQAELHGLLTKVRDLGVTLLSVKAIDAGTEIDRLAGLAGLAGQAGQAGQAVRARRC